MTAPPAASPLPHGAFMVTLDFELAWGVRDKRSVDEYRENLAGVRTVVPRLLDLFEEYGVHSTWAIVGFLFFRDRDELLAALPKEKPDYADDRFSPYKNLNALGKNEEEDPFHFAHTLIEQIASRPRHEIASHTFSHYYCLEPGQAVEAFEADLDAALAAAARRGVTIESLVFPRNQFDGRYLDAARRKGIRAFRGNPPGGLYHGRSEEGLSLWMRALRVVDAYLKIAPDNGVDPSSIDREPPIDIPASRFLRPYSRKLAVFEPLRLRRIRAEMTRAAKRGRIYHLWWHPHNFGANMDRNFDFLRKILEHYRRLRDSHGMESLSMAGATRRLLGE